MLSYMGTMEVVQSNPPILQMKKMGPRKLVTHLQKTHLGISIVCLSFAYLSTLYGGSLDCRNSTWKFKKFKILKFKVGQFNPIIYKLSLDNESYKTYLICHVIWRNERC